MFWSHRQALKKAGLLGINQRNADFLLPYNERRFYPQVDDKVRTKNLALAADIAVPELYCLIETPRQIRELERMLGPYTEFVIKPAEGSGGEGILIVTGRSKGRYRLIDGSLLNQGELNYHVSSILSGIYSLGGQSDKAIVEYRVKPHPLFADISYQGVPDIRTIVFLGVPVMSMIRLPTRKSRGKANLHQGAIGAGINLRTGATLTAVAGTEIVAEHPDTGHLIEGLSIPNWSDVLTLATRSYELTDLKYQGVDIVLDRDRGAMILELNARPGLSIQLANRAGLTPRLHLIKENIDHLESLEARINFAQEHFGF